MRETDEIPIALMRETDAIRYGLLALHWGWVLIILNPANPLAHYPGYRNFMLVADVHTWIIASIMMASLALAGFLPWFWLQEASLVIQAFWLLGFSTLFASMLPPTTGTIAYAVFGFLASYAAVARLARYWSVATRVAYQQTPHLLDRRP